MAHMNFGVLRNTLKKVRQKSRPPCSSLEELRNLMETDENVFKTFGEFRDEDFYQETLKFGENRACLFVAQPIVRHLPVLCNLYVDGTFRTAPVGSKQVLIIFAEIGGKVIFLISITFHFLHSKARLSTSTPASSV